MATFVTTVTSDSLRKGVTFSNNTGTITADSTLNIVDDFTLSYAIKQISNDTAHFCKGEPEDPSIASGMIYTESVGKKLRLVIFDVNGTDVLSVITDDRVLASNKSKVVQIRYKQSTDLLEVFIDGVPVSYTVETSELYYHTLVSDLTGIDTNNSNMTFGSASGKTDFDGTIYGAMFDLEYLNNTDLNLAFNALEDVVTNLDIYQHLAFVSNRSGVTAIHLMSQDGNDATLINNSFTTPLYLNYSEDGLYIALDDSTNLIANGIDGDGGVLGTPPQPLQTGTKKSTYNYSDSTEYLYVGQNALNGSYDELRVSTNGGTPVVLLQDLSIKYGVAVNNNGNYLYTTENNNIVRYDYPTMTNKVNLYISGTAVFNFVLSKDGTKIAFSKVVGAYYQVFVMNSDGSSPLQITFGSYSSYPSDINIDNSKVLITSYIAGATSQVQLINIDGTNLQNISNNAYFERWATFKPIV
jgi:hypothetical protein